MPWSYFLFWKLMLPSPASSSVTLVSCAGEEEEKQEEYNKVDENDLNWWSELRSLWCRNFILILLLFLYRRASLQENESYLAENKKHNCCEKKKEIKSHRKKRTVGSNMQEQLSCHPADSLRNLEPSQTSSCQCSWWVERKDRNTLVEERERLVGYKKRRRIWHRKN